MFSIAFTDEPLEYPYDDTNIPAAPGTLVLGKCSEDFLANLSTWSKSEYESHWRRELMALLQGKAKVALVVSFNDPKAASNIEIWRLYRDGDWVHFQNQLRWYDTLPRNFDVARMSEYIEDRVVTNPEGDWISEWDAAIRDIELFLHRSG